MEEQKDPLCRDPLSLCLVEIEIAIVWYDWPDQSVVVSWMIAAQLMVAIAGLVCLIEMLAARTV
jgi:hypothetical protein